MGNKSYRILAINPGSTSTKVAVYDNLNLIEELTLRHSAAELSGFKNIIDQFTFRKDIIISAVEKAGVELSSIDVVIGRGGLLKPIRSGTYKVNDSMKRDLRSCVYGAHASNLGGLIAWDIADAIGVDAYIADPVVVDELQDVARISGSPLIERISIFHALNQKAIAREYGEREGRAYESMNLVVAHLGGGISVGAHRKGEVIDVNNALDGEGPFSPERAGTLPAGQLLKLALSGDYSRDQLLKMITGSGGVVAHLGTNDMIEVENRAKENDPKYVRIQDAMCYTIAKSIGMMATVLDGKVDAIILTGGIAYGKDVCDYITKMVQYIAPVVVIAGENELEALAANALSVVEGKTKAKEYS